MLASRLNRITPQGREVCDTLKSTDDSRGRKYKQNKKEMVLDPNTILKY